VDAFSIVHLAVLLRAVALRAVALGVMGVMALVGTMTLTGAMTLGAATLVAAASPATASAGSDSLFQLLQLKVDMFHVVHLLSFQRSGAGSKCVRRLNKGACSNFRWGQESGCRKRFRVDASRIKVQVEFGIKKDPQPVEAAVGDGALRILTLTSKVNGE
jgi:hypothetical protein